MIKLIMMKGLPGCGKTTEALRLVKEEGYKRVNKDDLRAMIDGGKHSKENEKNIIEARDLLVIHYLDSGYNVVVDDTNFNLVHADSLAEIADNCDAEFEERFIDTPIDICLARDAKRGDKSVGGDVIFRMYYKYLRPRQVPYDPMIEDACIFDLDGTLALMKDRSPFDWDRVGEDLVNEPVAIILDRLKKYSKIIIISGRQPGSSDETLKWLKENNIYYDFIHMRQAGDERKDAIIKKEIYDEHVKGKFNVMAVFDDRDQVVSLWRSLGLPCFQVDYGNF